MTSSVRRNLLPVILIAALVLAGCVSAARMLDRAEAAWSAGQYDQAIYQALGSYERAVEQNKDPDEIDAAKSFLIDRFPQANSNLAERAQRQLSGTDTEKTMAWQTYQLLVDMNRRIRDSIASPFLTAGDFEKELADAKDVAAQIKYVKALELMGQDRRPAYIEAAGLLAEIDSFVPDYRDIRVLRQACIDAGTLTVAFSDREVYLAVTKGSVPGLTNLGSPLRSVVRKFVETNDHPEFLKFVTAGSVQSAKDAGAVLFIEVQGEVRVSAETIDRYLQDGSITWKRSYTGSPALIVTRTTDSRTEVASSSLALSQEVDIEFFPKKYSTTSLTPEMYANQFNNTAWMASQLGKAQAALTAVNGSADMIIWAEMQYGGVSSFLTTASVTGTEGTQVLPIDPAVFEPTRSFINQSLPAFLVFQDMKLQDRLVKEATDQMLAVTAVRDLLSNLDL